MALCYFLNVLLKSHSYLENTATDKHTTVALFVYTFCFLVGFHPNHWLHSSLTPILGPHETQSVFPERTPALISGSGFEAQLHISPVQWFEKVA